MLAEKQILTLLRVLTVSFIALASTTQASLSAETVTIIVGGIEKQIYLPAKLTESLGYFRDEGLDVQLLSERSGVDAVDELLAGKVQGVIGFYDHCVDLQSKGKFVESIVQLALTPGEVELVSTRHPEIQSPSDFHGKTLGVTGLGSSSNFLTQYLAVKSGVALGEFTSIPVGSGDVFISAMRQDLIQAGMTTEPTVSRLLNAGEAKILVDLRSPDTTRQFLGGTYPGASLFLDTRWIEGHRDIAQKLANAFVRSLHYIATHSADDIADKLPVEFMAGDRATYVASLAVSKQMFTVDGLMPEDGPKTVFNVLQAFSRNMKGKTIVLSKTYRTEFAKAAK